MSIFRLILHLSGSSRRAGIRPYRIFVNRKIGKAIGGDIGLFFSFANVDFSLGASNNNVASLGFPGELENRRIKN